MRLRIPELLDKRGLTAYALAKQSRGRISRAMAYRYVQQRGAFRCLSPEQISALCEILEVTPGGLFEGKAARKRRS